MMDNQISSAETLNKSKKYIVGLLVSLTFSQAANAITLGELESMRLEEQGTYFSSVSREKFTDTNGQCIKDFERNRNLYDVKKVQKSLDGEKARLKRLIDKYGKPNEIITKKHEDNIAELTQRLEKAKSMDVELEFTNCLRDNDAQIQETIFNNVASNLYDFRNVKIGDHQIIDGISKQVDDNTLRVYLLESSYPKDCVFNVLTSAGYESGIVGHVIKPLFEQEGYKHFYPLYNSCPAVDEVYKAEVMPRVHALLDQVTMDLIAYRDLLEEARLVAKEEQEAKYQQQVKKKQEEEKLRQQAFEEKVSKLRNGTLKPQNFDEALWSVNKKKQPDGELILRPQAFRSFDNAYMLGTLDSGNIESNFIVKSRSVNLMGKKDIGYFEVKVTDKTKVFTSLKKNDPIYRVHVLGDMIDKKAYTTVGGETRYMAIIEASYISY